MRIVLKRWKFVYIVGGYAALFLIARIDDFLPSVVSFVADYLLWIVYLLVAVRTFRGANEPVGPPRPWWRMSGRPKAGFWLAALFGLSTSVIVLEPTPTFPLGFLVAEAVQNGVFALFYLNSSIQLVRRGTVSNEASSDE